MANKKLYVIEGIIEIEGAEIIIEEHTKKKERFIRAYSLRQATFLFSKRFEEIFKRGVFIGSANIIQIKE